MHRMIAAGLLASSSLLLAAGAHPADDLKALKGTVKIDGSSTVFPITEAVAEEFNKQARKVRVTVG
ncbi:MAG: hypothetical protein ACKO0W_01120, partial [Planctomycetota bacterium]